MSLFRLDWHTFVAAIINSGRRCKTDGFGRLPRSHPDASTAPYPKFPQISQTISQNPRVDAASGLCYTDCHREVLCAPAARDETGESRRVHSQISNPPYRDVAALSA